MRGRLLLGNQHKDQNLDMPGFRLQSGLLRTWSG